MSQCHEYLEPWPSWCSTKDISADIYEKLNHLQSTSHPSPTKDSKARNWCIVLPVWGLRWITGSLLPYQIALFYSLILNGLPHSEILCIQGWQKENIQDLRELQEAKSSELWDCSWLTSRACRLCAQIISKHMALRGQISLMPTCFSASSKIVT